MEAIWATGLGMASRLGGMTTCAVSTTCMMVRAAPCCCAIAVAVASALNDDFEKSTGTNIFFSIKSCTIKSFTHVFPGRISSLKIVPFNIQGYGIKGLYKLKKDKIEIKMVFIHRCDLLLISI